MISFKDKIWQRLIDEVMAFDTLSADVIFKSLSDQEQTTLRLVQRNTPLPFGGVDANTHRIIKSLIEAGFVVNIAVNGDESFYAITLLGNRLLKNYTK